MFIYTFLYTLYIYSQLKYLDRKKMTQIAEQMKMEITHGRNIQNIQKYVCCKHVVNIHAYMGTLTVEKIKCLHSYKLFDEMEINTPS